MRLAVGSGLGGLGSMVDWPPSRGSASFLVAGFWGRGRLVPTQPSHSPPSFPTLPLPWGRWASCSWLTWRAASG